MVRLFECIYTRRMQARACGQRASRDAAVTALSKQLPGLVRVPMSRQQGTRPPSAPHVIADQAKIAFAAPHFTEDSEPLHTYVTSDH
ncbi:hypothetical protein XFF6166_50028 [Xanthomonas citri pv. fuscans]|nr:hypothetical protein XFF6166_50028 [Xanthomonas citri pv. fuscans]SON99074.1 hypothetical protein XFF6960_120028 [Xanthomonas citri pv. fuscans]SOO04008.1 hypothetical protein XFF7767_210022 [Xanthomonas citri pv. fuscans]SOO09164.1 hypothetical protein XFF6970_320021 [Xanthomonas citri pv. fuscans]SOO13313.1 hypothetical protein XFF7766_150026 [Xanthomonas citri pv. fuscans]